MFNPFDYYTIALREWADIVITWLTTNYRDFFQAIKVPVELVLEWTETFLLWLHPLAFLALLLVVAWRIAGWRVAVFSVVALLFLGYLGCGRIP
jgi:ABC-type proline/glycine betaine transport system permease subunit